MCMSKVRNSNIELLRIISMLFIISHHFLVHGMHIWQDSSSSNFLLLSLDACFYVAVNVFVLISGYFGIRFEWKKILTVYFLTAFIGLFCYLTHLFIDDASFGRSVIWQTVFSISHGHTWFIRVWIYLFLFSPIINTALNTFDKQQLQLVLFLLTIICVYFGWFWQGEVNKDGYNLINFIWIYSIGYYLNHFFEYNAKCSLIYIVVWLLCSIINVILFIILDSYCAWTYNNPFIVVASIAFFLYFRSLNFISKSINAIAQCTLGVYLIHEHAYISPIIYGEKVASIYSSNIIYFIISVLLLFSLCAVIDFIIRKILLYPVLDILSRAHKKNYS